MTPDVLFKLGCASLLMFVIGVAAALEWNGLWRRVEARKRLRRIREAQR